MARTLPVVFQSFVSTYILEDPKSLTFFKDSFHLFPSLAKRPVRNNITATIRACREVGVVAIRVKVHRPVNEVHYILSDQTENKSQYLMLRTVNIFEPEIREGFVETWLYIMVMGAPYFAGYLSNGKSCQKSPDMQESTYEYLPTRDARAANAFSDFLLVSVCPARFPIIISLSN